MNWLDFILAAVLVISIVNGLKEGFARTAIGFGAFILALFCGLWFYGLAGARLEEYLGSTQAANLIGFLVIFIGILILGALAGHLLDRVLKAAQLSWLNRLLGGLFGFVRGALVAAVIVLGAMAFPAKEPPRAVTNSRLSPYVIDTARVMVALAPREVKDAFANSYERIQKIWSDTLQKGIRRIPEQNN